MFKPLNIVALLSALVAAPAMAATIDLTNGLATGILGPSATYGGVTITAWSVSKVGNTWTPAVLVNRHDGLNDYGLGVCLAGAECPLTDYGFINEIDNNGAVFDVIRLDFGAPTNITGVGLSSLDSGLKDGFGIYAGNTAQPGITTLSNVALITSGTNASIGAVNPDIFFNTTARYLFITPKELGLTAAESDFLFSRVIGDTPIPEPSTYLMLGAGLTILGLRARKRRS
jgi:hypothetical protein